VLRYAFGELDRKPAHAAVPEMLLRLHRNALRLLRAVTTGGSPEARSNRSVALSEGIFEMLAMAPLRAARIGNTRENARGLVIAVESLSALHSLIIGHMENRMLLLEKEYTPADGLGGLPGNMSSFRAPLRIVTELMLTSASTSLRAVCFLLLTESLKVESGKASVGFLSELAPAGVSSLHIATNKPSHFTELATRLKQALVSWPDTDAKGVFYASRTLMWGITRCNNPGDVCDNLLRCMMSPASRDKSDSLFSRIWRSLGKMEREGCPRVAMVGVLQLMCCWLHSSSEAINALSWSAATLPFVLELISDPKSNEHVRGLAVLVIGVCLEHEKDHSGVSRDTLVDIVKNRVGITDFTSFLDDLRASNAFTAALSESLSIYLPVESMLDKEIDSPVILGAEDLGHTSWYDKAFADVLNDVYQKLNKRIVELFATLPDAGTARAPPRGQAGSATARDPQSDDSYQQVIQSYKDLITTQDQDLTHVKNENDELKRALAEAHQSLDHKAQHSEKNFEESSEKLLAALDDAEEARRRLQDVENMLEVKNLDMEAILASYNGLEAEYAKLLETSPQSDDPSADGNGGASQAVGSDFVEELNDMKAQNTKLQSMMSKQDSEMKALEIDLTNTKKENEDLKSALRSDAPSGASDIGELIQLRNDVEKHRALLDAKVSFAEELESELEIVQAALVESRSKEVSHRKSAESLTVQNKNIQAELERIEMSRSFEMKALKEEYEGRVIELSEENASLKSTLDSSNHEAQVAQLAEAQGRISELQADFDTYRAENLALTEELRALRCVESELRKDVETLVAQYEDAQHQANATRSEKEIERNENARLGNLVKELQQNLSDVKQSADLFEKSDLEKSSKIRDLESQLTSLISEKESNRANEDMQALLEKIEDLSLRVDELQLENSGLRRDLESARDALGNFKMSVSRTTEENSLKVQNLQELLDATTSSVAQVEAALKATSDSLAQTKDKYKETKMQLEQEESKNDALQKTLGEMNENIAAYEDELQEARAKNSQLRVDLKVYVEEAEKRIGRSTSLEQKIAALKEQVQELEEELSGKSEEVSLLESALESARDENSQMRESREISNADANETLQTLLQEKDETINRLQESSEESAGTIADLESRLESLHADVQNLQEERSLVGDELSNLKAAINEKDGTIDSMRADASLLEGRLKESEENISRLTQQLEAMVSTEAQEKVLAELSEKLKEKEEYALQLEEELRLASEDKGVLEMKEKELFSAEEKIRALNGSLDENSLEISHLNSQVLSIRDELSATAVNLKVREEEIEDALENAAALSNDNSSLKVQVDDLKLQLSETRANEDELKAAMTALRSELEEERNTLNTMLEDNKRSNDRLSEDIEKYSGELQETVKQLQQAKEANGVLLEELRAQEERVIQSVQQSEALQRQVEALLLEKEKLEELTKESPEDVDLADGWDVGDVDTEAVERDGLQDDSAEDRVALKSQIDTLLADKKALEDELAKLKLEKEAELQQAQEVNEAQLEKLRVQDERVSESVQQSEALQHQIQTLLLEKEKLEDGTRAPPEDDLAVGWNVGDVDIEAVERGGLQDEGGEDQEALKSQIEALLADKKGLEDELAKLSLEKEMVSFDAWDGDSEDGDNANEKALDTPEQNIDAASSAALADSRAELADAKTKIESLTSEKRALEEELAQLTLEKELGDDDGWGESPQNAALETLEGEKGALEQKVKLLQDAFENEKSEAKRLHDSIAATSAAKISALEAATNTFETELECEKQKCASLAVEKASAEKEMRAQLALLQENVSESNKALEVLRTELQSRERTHSELQLAIAEKEKLTEELARVHLEIEMSAMNGWEANESESESLRNQIAELESDKLLLNAKVEALEGAEERCADLKLELARHVESQASMKSSTERLNQDLAAKTQEMDSLLAKVSRLSDAELTQKAVAAECDELRAALQAKSEELESASNSLSPLQEQVANLEGLIKARDAVITKLRQEAANDRESSEPAELRALKSELAELKLRASTQAIEIERLTSAVRDKEKVEATLRKNCDDLRHDLTIAQEKNAALSSASKSLARVEEYLRESVLLLSSSHPSVENKSSSELVMLHRSLLESFKEDMENSKARVESERELALQKIQDLEEKSGIAAAAAAESQSGGSDRPASMHLRSQKMKQSSDDSFVVLLKRTIEDLEMSIRTSRSEADEANAEVEYLSKELDSLRNEVVPQLEGALMEAEMKYSALSEEFSALEQTSADQELKLMGKSNENDSLLRQVSDLETRLESATIQTKILRQESTQSDGKIIDLQEELKCLNEVSEKARHRADEESKSLKQQLEKLTAALADAHQKFVDQTKISESFQGQVSALEEKLKSADLARSKLEDSKRAMSRELDDLNREYAAMLNDSDKYRSDTEGKLHALASKVRSLEGDASLRIVQEKELNGELVKKAAAVEAVIRERDSILSALESVCSTMELNLANLEEETAAANYRAHDLGQSLALLSGEKEAKEKALLEVTALKSVVAENEASIDDLVTELNESREALSRLEPRFVDKSQKLDDVSRLNIDLSAENETLQEKVNQLKEQNDEFSRQLTKLGKELSDTKSELIDIKTRNSVVSSGAVESRRRIETLESQLLRANREAAKVEHLESLINAVAVREKDLKEKALLSASNEGALAAQLKSATRDLNTLRAEYEEQTKVIANLKADGELHLAERSKDYESSLEKERNMRKDFESQVKSLSKELDGMSDQLQEGKKTFALANAELKNLREAVRVLKEENGDATRRLEDALRGKEASGAAAESFGQQLRYMEVALSKRDSEHAERLAELEDCLIETSKKCDTFETELLEAKRREQSLQASNSSVESLKEQVRTLEKKVTDMKSKQKKLIEFAERKEAAVKKLSRRVLVAERENAETQAQRDEIKKLFGDLKRLSIRQATELQELRSH